MTQKQDAPETGTLPRTLGRYRLLQLLGRGGMGEVYLAMVIGAAGFERPVALKLLSSGHARASSGELLREAFIGVRLETEHVVQVLDLGEQDGRYFLVMEYVRGFTLGHVLLHAQRQGEPLPVWAVAHVIRTIASALDYVHRVKDPKGQPLGLSHRDVSPSNVLIGIDGRIKLSDFGVAGLWAGEGRERLLAGKVGYLPPEAFSGAPPGPAWDLYALGIILYEALTGRRAFDGTTPKEMLQAFRVGVRPLGELRPDCSQELVAMVERAIHHDPGRRYRSAAELRSALDVAVRRDVDTHERFAELVEELYGRRSFVGQHGLLPTTNDLEDTVKLQAGEFECDTDPLGGPLIPLRIGLSPALGPTVARAHGERLAAWMEKRMGRPVRIVVLADYRALIEQLVAGEVDLTWTPPAVFVEAENRGATALMVARRRGATHYESAIIVRRDSTYKKLEDLKGQPLAWVDPESAGGYLFALAELVRAFGPAAEKALGRQHFHGSHQAVCQAVLNGWAAAGATYAVRNQYGEVLASGCLDLVNDRADELRLLAFSRSIPGDSIAVRPGMPPKVAERLAAALGGLGLDTEGRQLLAEIFNAEALVRADPAIYAQAREIIRLMRRVADPGASRTRSGTPRS